MTVMSLIRDVSIIQPEYLFFLLLNLMPVKDVILTTRETWVCCNP